MMIIACAGCGRDVTIDARRRNPKPVYFCAACYTPGVPHITEQRLRPELGPAILCFLGEDDESPES